MKRFSVLAIAVLLAALSTGLNAFAFEDVKDAEQNTAAQAIASLGIMEGWDGNFHPNENFTREMFAKVAVKTMNAENLSSLYKDFTLFPDVLNTAWSAPYVNVSAKKGIIGGFPDGTFRPSAVITDAQAITICLRVLGYKTADIGPLWPDSYLERAKSIGLTEGLTVSAEGKMTRGRAAVLVRNMLMTRKVADGVEGNLLVLSLAATAQSDISMLAVGGSYGENVVVTSAGKFECVKPLDRGLAGTRGVLLLSAGGKVTGFIPYRYHTVTINATAATSSFVEGGGKKYIIQPSTTVLIRETTKQYSECWYNITPGMTITVNLDSSGGVVYLSCGYATQVGAPF